MRKSVWFALAAVFAALHAVLYTFSLGLWRNWAIYLESIEGVVLGPWLGLFTAFLGSGIGRLANPDAYWMFGMIAEPIGVLAAGFLAKGKWREIMVIYGLMLVAYFVHPYGRMLPLWTVLDLLVVFALIYPVSRIGKAIWGNPNKRFQFSLLLVAFVSTVADSMTRVFLFVPAGLYQIFDLSYEELHGIFILGAVNSYTEDVLVPIVTLIACVPLLASLKRILGLKQPLS